MKHKGRWKEVYQALDEEHNTRRGTKLKDPPDPLKVYI